MLTQETTKELCAKCILCAKCGEFNSNQGSIQDFELGRGDAHTSVYTCIRVCKCALVTVVRKPDSETDCRTNLA